MNAEVSHSPGGDSPSVNETETHSRSRYFTSRSRSISARIGYDGDMNKDTTDEPSQIDVYIKTEPTDYNNEGYIENKVDLDLDSEETDDVHDNGKRKELFEKDMDLDQGDRSRSTTVSSENEVSAKRECNEYARKQSDPEMGSSNSSKRAADEVLCFRHNLGILPGPFAVSLVDRNHDPSLTIVFHCWICDAEFLDKLGIIKHLKELHMDIPGVEGIEKKMRLPVCLTCGLSGGCEHRSINEDEEEDEGKATSDGHLDDKANGKFPCTQCSINFSTFNEQRDHFSKQHPNQRMYKCTYCPDSFYQHHKLVVHTRTHTGYKPYACGICGSKFPKNSDLNRHIRTHSTKGEKPFQCAQCGQTFTQKCSLEKHARRHADKDGGYPCFHCGLTFVYESDLDAHSKKEHGERTWKCVDCGKMFEERRHLIVHAKTHQAGIKYQCSYCDRTFTKRHQLAKHEDRIHHRQDDLTCKVCHKEFRRRENLTRHMNIHLDKREFQCTQCGMAFTEKGSLKRHVLSRHEQHRPFKCRVCGKAFSRRFLLRKHHLRAHKLFPYEGEENPVPTRGFGAKRVNIDSYIRKKSDADSNIALPAEAVFSHEDEAKDKGDNSASGSGIADEQDEDMAGVKSRYEEDTDGDMDDGRHAFDGRGEEEEEEEWGSN